MKGMPNYTMPCLFLICVLPLMVQAQQVQHQKQAPAWLKRSRESASAKTMVTAVGKGRTRSEALSDVESKLAERIWSGIDLNEQQRKEYENLLRQEGAPLRNTLALLSTAADYRGLSLLRNQAVDQYRDSDYVYLLGGFDRTSAEKLYSGELHRLGGRIDRYHRQSERSGDLIKATACARTALNLANVQRILYAQLLNITDEPPKKVETYLVSTATLQHVFESKRNRARIRVTGQSLPPALSRSIKKALTQAGLIIADNRSAPIRAEVSFTQRKATHPSKNAEFSHWTLTVHFKESARQASYATYSTKGREGALTYNDASRRAQQAAVHAAGESFVTFIHKQLLYPKL